MDITNLVIIVTTMFPKILVTVVVPLILLVVLPVTFIKDNLR